MNPNHIYGDAPNAPGSETGIAQDTIGPFPYFPGLRKIVPNISCAVFVTYLEMRFPAPQDSPERVSSLPVMVSCQQMMDELQIGRRTLTLNLHAISRVYRQEAKRWACARAAREFINQHHRVKGTRKLYSLVCDKGLDSAHHFILRRNLPYMRQIFKDTGITHLAAFTVTYSRPRDSCTSQETASEYNKLPEAPALVSRPSTLVDLLLEASQLSGDRRRVRYPRLRKAVADGLEPKSVLSAKQPKRRKSVSEAVEPELPEEITGRLYKLQNEDVEEDLGSAGGRGEG